MNYLDLPVSERIKLASDYALLLIEESLNDEEMLSDLQERFHLTQAEALMAYNLTRTVHTEEFSRLQNASIYKAILAFLVSIICGFFYLFLGNETGIVIAVIGIIFLVAAYGAMVLALQKIIDKFFYSPTLTKKRVKRNKKEEKEEPDWTVRLVLLSQFFLIIAGFLYFKKDGVVSIKNIVTLKQVLLKQPLEKKGSGKGAEPYFAFYFRQYPNEFRFYRTYYKYAPVSISSFSFLPNDTLAIQITESDYQNIFLNGSKKDGVDMVNIFVMGRPLINLATRNSDQLRINKLVLQLAIAFVILSFCVMVFRHKLAADRDKQLGLT